MHHQLHPFFLCIRIEHFHVKIRIRSDEIKDIILRISKPVFPTSVSYTHLGTQLRDNVKILYDYGAKEVHMRIACPPLIYACPFVGFSASKNALELITRRIIKELEGDENKNLEKYATTGSPEYEKMVSIIAERFGLSSLKFNTLETLIEAIGLPKCKVCTHCFDGSLSLIHI